MRLALNEGQPVAINHEIPLTFWFEIAETEYVDHVVDFESAYAARNGAGKPFSEAPEAQQIAWLHEVDKTPFFAAVRRLTVLGLIALPKYGGNHDNTGWALIGVVDNHAWEPPFGYYDKDYEGFVPYPGTKPYTL